MSYVNKNLMDGEQVMHRTRRHWIIFSTPLVFFLIGIVVLLVTAVLSSNGEINSDTAWILILIAALAGFIALATAIPAWIERRTSEFAVTNKRVIVKIGWIRRRSDETLLTKIEGIEVIQGIWARMLNYGTIIITGTGGSREPFSRIAAPLLFRRKVQEQILAIQNMR
jgi:membrane protein YdbS with pleckstrin-like domain